SLTSIVNLPFVTLCESSPSLTSSVRFLVTVIVWSLPTLVSSSSSTTRTKSFWAWKYTTSLPFLSSKYSSLKSSAPPPLLLRDLKPLLVASSGSVYGGMLVALYTQPVTSGRSGSPSRNSTITSCPIRGWKNAPQFLP